jgi:hypothetical protein
MEATAWAAEYNERVKAARTSWLVGGVLAAAVGCSGPTGAWVATGEYAAFPSPLPVDKATAITIDATYIYWITTDGFLYRAPRSAGSVDRVRLPAPGTLLGSHNDVFVGWTDGSGNAAIADITPATGMVAAMNQQPGALVALVAGQHGYSFAAAAPGGTRVQACLNGVCSQPEEIESAFKSLALDLPTRTFYVLTVDGLRTCTLSGGCPAQAAATPAAATLIAALPGTYFFLDSNGQASAKGGSPNLGSAAVPGATKLVVVDGNGHTTSPVGTWSNGSRLAQCLLAPATTTSQVAMACSDFDVDATGRPIYCLVGSSTIQIIP